MTTEERKKGIQNLIEQYKQELGDALVTSERFEINRLPTHIQEIIKLVTAKAPSFSNVAALGVTNYGIAHVLGQLRPKINDVAYSPNQIGCNVYTVIIANSGSGKSSSANTLMETFKPALELVEHQRKQQMVQVAKKIALREIQKTEPERTPESITEADYDAYVKPLNRITASAASTRGGISTLVAKLQKEEFSNLSIMIDELGLALKSGNTTDEVLAFLTEAFDMGNNEAPEFKGEDVKEVSIEGMYTNLMAHTAPKIVFQYEAARDKLSMIFHTAFARRVFFSFPDEDESCENNPVPINIEEARKLTAKRRKTIANYAVDISNKMTRVVSKMLADPDERLVSFSPDAAKLYSDYFDYCTKRAEVMEDSSITQIEMAGRTFRMGKLAALWALSGGSNEITYDTMKAVIYYTEYNSKYLEKFTRLTNAQPFEILADIFRTGKTTHVTLDSAITNGYISRVSKDFKELIEPLNSALRRDGVCSYNEDTKTFIYTPFVKVEQPKPEPTTGKVNHQFTMSYNLIPEHLKRTIADAPAHLETEKEKTDWVKQPRLSFIDSFSKCRSDLGFENIINLLTRDSVYSNFQYEEGYSKSEDKIVPNKRGEKHVISSTKLVIIDVDKSQVDMQSIHSYLSSYQHIIATSSNKDNKYKFRILLPINVELDGKDTRQYSYVTKRIAADLLVTADRVSHVTSQPFYGYEGAEVLTQETGRLYDVTEYLSEYASGNTAPDTQLKAPKTRSPKARAAHVQKIMDDVNTIFSYVIEAQMGEGSFMLARASKHMIDEGFNKEEYETVIRYINDTWEIPMEETRFKKTILDQFLSQMQG